MRRQRGGSLPRHALERKGAVVPADDDPVHVPRAFLCTSRSREYGQADEILPIYVRAPDAKVRSPA